MRLPQPEPDLWQATPQLEAIQQWAHSQRLSPAGLLITSLTYLNACDFWMNIIPGPDRNDPYQGVQPASLYSLLIGPSSAGKNRTIRLVKNILHLDITHLTDSGARFPKTPEGIYSLYLGKDKDDEGNVATIQMRHQVLATFPELASFLEVANRPGNWYREAISDMWNGHFPSQDIKDRQASQPALASNTHFSIVAGGQPQAAADLFGGINIAQGLASRWLVASAIDTEMPAEAPSAPPPIFIPANPSSINRQHRWNLIEEPEEVWQYVEQTLLEGHTHPERPLQPGHSGHDVLQARKILKGIAQLNGHRTCPDLTDWHITLQVLDHSRQMKAAVQEYATSLMIEIHQQQTDLSIHQHQARRTQAVKLEIHIQKTWQKLASTYGTSSWTRTDLLDLTTSAARKTAKLSGTRMSDIIIGRTLHHNLLIITGNQHRLKTLPEELPPPS